MDASGVSAAAYSITNQVYSLGVVVIRSNRLRHVSPRLRHATGGEERIE